MGLCLVRDDGYRLAQGRIEMDREESRTGSEEQRVRTSNNRHKALRRVGEPENRQPGELHDANAHLPRRHIMREHQLAFSVHVMRRMNEGAAIKYNCQMLATSCELQVIAAKSSYLRRLMVMRDRSRRMIS